MTTTPSAPLTGQDIGEAANATRAVLDVLLDEIGTTFETWVALNTLAQQGPVIRRDVLRRDLAAGFRTDVSSVSELLGRLEVDGLIRDAAGSGVGDAAGIELTADGDALWRRVRDGIGRITAELYGGLDPNDLATARRVLREVIERAKARQAG